MMKPDSGGLLSVVVRSASAARLQLLDEAMFSLASQHYQEIEVIVVLQNPDAGHFEEVVRLAARQPWRKAAKHKVLNVRIPAGVDGRAVLLTEGCKSAAGRYLAFLDDDDVVYPGAYCELIAALSENRQAVMAAGQTRIAHIKSGEDYYKVESKSTAPYNLNKTRFDLLLGNFIPIHSYVVDRSRVREDIFVFRTESVPLEDYEFLLRLASHGPFDLSRRHIPVCEYRFHESNSIGSGTTVSAALDRALKDLDDILKTFRIPVGREDWEALRAQQIPLQPADAQPWMPKRRTLVRAADKVYDFTDFVRDGLRAARHRLKKLVTGL